MRNALPHLPSPWLCFTWNKSSNWATLHFLVCGGTPIPLSSLESPRASCRHGWESNSTPKQQLIMRCWSPTPHSRLSLYMEMWLSPFPSKEWLWFNRKFKGNAAPGVVESQPCNAVAYSHPCMCDTNPALPGHTALAESRQTTQHLWHPPEGDVNPDSESDTVSLQWWKQQQQPGISQDFPCPALVHPQNNPLTETPFCQKLW